MGRLPIVSASTTDMYLGASWWSFGGKGGRWWWLLSRKRCIIGETGQNEFIDQFTGETDALAQPGFLNKTEGAIQLDSRPIGCRHNSLKAAAVPPTLSHLNCLGQQLSPRLCTQDRMLLEGQACAMAAASTPKLNVGSGHHPSGFAYLPDSNQWPSVLARLGQLFPDPVGPNVGYSVRRRDPYLVDVLPVGRLLGANLDHWDACSR